MESLVLVVETFSTESMPRVFINQGRDAIGFYPISL